MRFGKGFGLSKTKDVRFGKWLILLLSAFSIAVAALRLREVSFNLDCCTAAVGKHVTFLLIVA